MLGFIMSKMQMLFFAVGIAVVAFLFLNFVSVIGLQRTADSLLLTDIKLISDQSTSDVLCSFKQTALPDKLVYGVNSAPFFYDLEFEKESILSSTEDSSATNVLIMRIVEHRTASKTGEALDPSKKKVVSAKSIAANSEFVLIDPSFLADLSPLNESTYNVKSISLYPRAASTGANAAAPNGFVALSETSSGKKTVYIIPCASEKEPNNCLMNIFRVGCYKLKLRADVTSTTLMDTCFNIQLPSVDSTSKTKNFTWKDCVTMFPAIAN